MSKKKTNEEVYRTAMTMIPEGTPEREDVSRPAAGNDESPPETAYTEMTMLQESPPPEKTTGTPAPRPSHPEGPRTLQPGDQVDKYIVIKLLGRGGMGSVYLVRHATLGVYRALKVLSRTISEENESFVTRFIQEANTAGTINHDNIVNVVDVDVLREQNLCYIVMEYIDGGTVRDVLRTTPRLSEEDTVIIMTAVAEALAAAAEHGIIHRDIKPDNIMLTRRGTVKLADLGIAKNNAEDIELTMSHMMMGTPAYLSPEQAKDAKTVDARADIYSLGASCFEMLTGRLPYPGQSTYDILGKLMSEPVPDPRSLVGTISPQTARLVMKMMAKKPRDRFASARELLREIAKLNILPPDKDHQESIKSLLENIGAGNYIPTSPETVLRSSIRRKRKRAFLWTLSGLLLAAVIVLAVDFTGCLSRFGWDKGTVGQSLSAKLPVPPDSPEAAVSAECELDIHPAGTHVAIHSAGGRVVYQNIVPANSRVRFAAPPGGYRVVLSAPGYHDLEERISVEAGLPFTRKLHLKPNEAAIPAVDCVFSVEPVGAEVVMYNDRNEVTAKGVVSDDKILSWKARPGEYKVVISCPGYHSLSQPVVVAEKEGVNKIYKLTAAVILPDLIRYEYTIHPTGAKAVLFTDKNESVVQNIVPPDGVLKFEVVPGTYRLVVSCQGYNTFSEFVVVRVGGSGPVRKELSLVRQLGSIAVSAPVGAEFRLMQRGRKIAEKTADSNGNAIFHDLPVGHYTLEGTAYGYQPAKHSVLVEDQKDAYVNADMKKNAPAVKPALYAPPPRESAPPAEAVAAEGVCIIDVKGSKELLAYLEKSDPLLQVDDGNWTPAKAFPCRLQLPRRKHRIGFKAYGVCPVPAITADLTGKAAINVDIYLQAEPAILEMEYKGTDPVHLNWNGTWEPFRKSITVAPFVKHEIKWKIDDRSFGDLTVMPLDPREYRLVKIIPPQIIIPFDREYHEAMDLLKQDKSRAAAEAIAKLKIAADGKHPRAAYQLGVLDENGVGRWFSSDDDAQKWYEQAAVEPVNNPDAQYKLGLFQETGRGSYSRNLKRALAWYQKAAAQKQTEALYRMAVAYKDGEGGLAKDPEKMLRFAEAAARQNQPDAQYLLGLCYEKGYHVPINILSAAEWYGKSAENGNQEARQRFMVLSKLLKQ